MALVAWQNYSLHTNYPVWQF